MATRWRFCTVFYICIYIVGNIRLNEGTKTWAIFRRVECIDEKNAVAKDLYCNLTEPIANGMRPLDFGFKTARYMENLMMHLIVRSNYGQTIDKEMLNVKLSFCTFLGKKRVTNLWEKVVYEPWKYGSLPTKCPIKKDVSYAVSDYKVGISLLPNWTPLCSYNLTFILYNEDAKGGLHMTIFGDTVRRKG